jgi:polysaccharide chain length determinant protein (PEP-CTERM system associated)
MINPEKSFDIHDYTEIFLRRIWYIIIPFSIILIGAILYAFYSPKVYRASTLILISPQKVPENFVRPTVTSKIEERLQSIGQEILSRTRLEQIISEFKLYSEEAGSLSREEMIDTMRKNVGFEARGKEGHFTVSYMGQDPKVVAMVTNKLASLFIEENLKLREQYSQGTSEFLSSELSATKLKLEQQEKAISQFKKQFVGELPEQRDANFRVLDQLQLQYQRIAENLRAAQDRKLIIQKELGDKRRSDKGLLIPSGSKDSPGKLEIQLEQMRDHLADLQIKYTEKHPDILVIKKKIAEIETKIENARLEKDLSPPIKVTELASPQMENKKDKDEEGQDVRLTQYKGMDAQLVATELEMKRLKEDEEKVKNQMTRYQGRIDSTFMRENALTNLTRDYQNTNETYQTLMRKSEEAQQAENLERRQKGEQFKVIDPARIPERPFKPNIPKILLTALLLGIGSGFGTAFLKEQMDRSFRDAEDLEATMGFKVLANIPKIEKKAA